MIASFIVSLKHQCWFIVEPFVHILLVQSSSEFVWKQRVNWLPSCMWIHRKRRFDWNEFILNYNGDEAYRLADEKMWVNDICACRADSKRSWKRHFDEFVLRLLLLAAEMQDLPPTVSEWQWVAKLLLLPGKLSRTHLHPCVLVKNRPVLRKKVALHFSICLVHDAWNLGWYIIRWEWLCQCPYLLSRSGVFHFRWCYLVAQNTEVVFLVDLLLLTFSSYKLREC